jgi:hypothetical protein
MRLRIPRHARRAAIATALAAQAAAALALATGALALSAPAVTTGSAHSVSFSSALITGSVNPNGSEAFYYVQYGQTKAYGAQTAPARAGSGTQKVSVSIALAGLQPLTQYHYRLVAVNAAGASPGSDATFLTTKVPLSLSIVAAPNPVPFGGTITISGVLSGTGNSERTVVLQANAFPFTAGFQSLGNPELTSASGGFSFPILGLSIVTQYRVVALTKPTIVSPVAVEAVKVRVDDHVGRAHRAHFVRIFGTVTPAEDGMHVGILRVVRHHRAVPVAGTVLLHRNAASSSFSLAVRVHRGTYRVLVRVTNGALLSAYGTPIRIG